jgi:putative aminopeptidase FrvX
MNGKLMAGRAFDDKACGAIAARAIIDTPREELAGDVYLTLSAREETARPSGAHCATFGIEPDYAFVIDVELGKAPDVAGGRNPKLGDGISVAFSAATDRELTRMTAELLEKKGVAFVRHASPSATGTNSTTVNLVLGGVPTVDIGLPLRNMHTYNEVLHLHDCNSLCGAVREFICSREIAERFAEVK